MPRRSSRMRQQLRSKRLCALHEGTSGLRLWSCRCANENVKEHKSVWKRCASAIDRCAIMKKSIRRAAAIGSCLVLFAHTSFADLANTAPWEYVTYGTYTVFTGVGAGGSYLNWESVSPSGDLDYFVVTCGPNTDITGIVDYVSISFTHSLGDLDMAVYTTNGKQVLGTSTGTTDTETVSVSSVGDNAVVVKVYGYAGATNPSYSIITHCI